MYFRYIFILIAFTFSIASQAKLEPETIDWGHTDRYVVNIMELDKYALARLIQEAEKNHREFVPLPANEQIYVLLKNSKNLPARTIHMEVINHEVCAPLEALESEMLERLAEVDNNRLFTLIRRAVDTERYEFPLYLVFEDSLSAQTMAASDVFSRPQASVHAPGSNRDDVTIPLDFLLSDIHSPGARVRISKELLRIRDLQYLSMRDFRPKTAVSEKILSTTTTFIAFTALHSSADGFRAFLHDHLISGKSRLRNQLLLLFELQKQAKDELLHPKLQVNENAFPWLHQAVADFIRVEGVRVHAEQLDPEVRLKSEQKTIDRLYNRSATSRFQAKNRIRTADLNCLSELSNH
jgi:GTP cyclohydrolase II